MSEESTRVTVSLPVRQALAGVVAGWGILAIVAQMAFALCIAPHLGHDLRLYFIGKSLSGNGVAVSTAGLVVAGWITLVVVAAASVAGVLLLLRDADWGVGIGLILCVIVPILVAGLISNGALSLAFGTAPGFAVVLPSLCVLLAIVLGIYSFAGLPRAIVRSRRPV